jgi:KDO2-lipid IV(A) lauroyltransferase
MPRRVAIPFADRVADVMYVTLFKKKQAIVIRNLRRVRKDMSLPEAKRTVLEIYRNFARFIYEFLVLPQLNRTNLFHYIDLEHEEHLDNALKQGKGALVLTAHFGNWEMGAATMGILGYRPTVISLSQSSNASRDFFTRRREAVGMKVAYVEEKLRPVLATLKRGNVVATLGDRVYTGRSVYGLLFGGKYAFPSGIFELGKRMRIPIVPGFCVKEGKKYRVWFESELTNGLAEWAQILEKHIERYITQWFVFDSLWD